MAVSMLVQKAMNIDTQSRGEKKEATIRRMNPKEDVAINTTARNVVTAANPKRQSLTHHNKPKKEPKATPKIMKKIHKTQQKSERATVLLKT